MEKCAVLLGSATPSLESYHNAVSRQVRTAPPDAARGRQEDAVHPHRGHADGVAKKSAPILSERLITAINDAAREKGADDPFPQPPRLLAPRCICAKVRLRLRMPELLRRAHLSPRGEPRRLPHLRPPRRRADEVPRVQGSRHQIHRHRHEKVEDAVAKFFPKAVVKRMDADVMQRRERLPRHARRLSHRQDRHPRRHADDRERAALSQRHARRHRQRRPRAAPAGFPRGRAHLPAPHAGRRARGPRRCRGRGLRAELHAVSPRDPVRAASRLRGLLGAGDRVPATVELPAVHAFRPHHRALAASGARAIFHRDAAPPAQGRRSRPARRSASPRRRRWKNRTATTASTSCCARAPS